MAHHDNVGDEVGIGVGHPRPLVKRWVDELEWCPLGVTPVPDVGGLLQHGGHSEALGAEDAPHDRKGQSRIYRVIHQHNGSLTKIDADAVFNLP